MKATRRYKGAKMTSTTHDNKINTETSTQREENFYADHCHAIHVQTDRMFAVLMTAQWIGGILIAMLVSPRISPTENSYIHPHVWTALTIGGLLSAFPIALALI